MERIERNKAFGIEDSHGQFTMDEDRVLKIWIDYIKKLYNIKPMPKNMETEAQEDVQKDKKRLSILKVVVARTMADIKRRKGI